MFRITFLVLWLALFSLGTRAESGLSSKCTKEELNLLPQFIKVKTLSSGGPRLLKISQAKKTSPTSCFSQTTTEGWRHFTFELALRTPLRISVYSATLGSLLWKKEQVFNASAVTLIKKQGDKEIYHFTLKDPHSPLQYEIELNMATRKAKLRVR